MGSLLTLEQTTIKCDCGSMFFTYKESETTKFVCGNCNRGYSHGTKPQRNFTRQIFFVIVRKLYDKQQLLEEIKRL